MTTTPKKRLILLVLAAAALVHEVALAHVARPQTHDEAVVGGVHEAAVALGLPAGLQVRGRLARHGQGAHEQRHLHRGARDDPPHPAERAGVAHAAGDLVAHHTDPHLLHRVVHRFVLPWGEGTRREIGRARDTSTPILPGSVAPAQPAPAGPRPPGTGVVR